ncbi:MAG: SpoIID/LytB domain-containing protein [Candidatus Obscuribacterales bacterium]|nr:SpoIID/LytB domain-containing protein [Candidatus Obscuribacterales bacterium]
MYILVKMMPKRLLDMGIILSLIIFALFQAPVFAIESELVVTLFKAHQPNNCLYIAAPFKISRGVQREFRSGVYEIKRDSGRFILQSKLHMNESAVYIAGTKLDIQPLGDYVRIGFKPDAIRKYRGKIDILAEGNALLCLNQVRMKDYVASVLGSETALDFPLEALKAQSVLIQTSMHRYKLNDELFDSTDKQAYLGADYERPRVIQAMQATWDQSLRYKSRLVPVFFHSSCAGGTSSSELFTGLKPELACDTPVACRYCENAPFWKSTKKRVSREKYDIKFPEGVPQVSSKDSSGRPQMLRYKNGKEERAYSFWLRVGQQLGWDKLPGTRFDIHREPDGDVVLSSTGAGHGVGLCQWGACGLAKTGASYEKILQYYFPGSTLAKH